MIADAAFGVISPELFALRVTQMLIMVALGGAAAYGILKRRQQEGRDKYNWYLQRGNARLEADRLARQREQRFGSREWT